MSVARQALSSRREPQAAFRPARRLSAIGVSEILAITERAAGFKKEGRPVIVLGAGEPDFDTPDHVKDAAARAMRDGATKYTTLDGSAEMKAAIREKFHRENGLRYAQDEITVSAGAKQILFNAMMASLDPGDEVIIPAPYWVTYADIVAICGGVPVVVPCSEENGFKLRAGDLDRAVTPRTRWLMLNSPSNPSGAAYTADDYRPVLDVVRRHPRVWLMADDIYEHIVYDDFKFTTPAVVAPDLSDRILTVNGVSKAYAMTGWRLGYGAGPRELIKAMAVVQSQSTSCPSSISQAAAIAALLGPQGFLQMRRADFQTRRDLVVAGLRKIKGLTCFNPQGAFYTFASCTGVIGAKTPSGDVLAADSDFCAFLLNEHNVAVVPGSAFGLPGHFRISYATGIAELQAALNAIASACATLRLP